MVLLGVLAIVARWRRIYSWGSAFGFFCLLALGPDFVVDLLHCSVAICAELRFACFLCGPKLQQFDS